MRRAIGFGPLPGLLLILACGIVPSPALAGGSAIDPEPGSALLGDLLDREEAMRRPPPPPPPRAARTEPRIPRGAVTVLLPGRRLRLR